MPLLSSLAVASRCFVRLPRHQICRYGSAAAALDFDFHSCYEDDWEPKPKMKMKVVEESEEGEMFGRGVQWVIMGDPTVRGHFYAQRLAKLLDVPYISMGSLVRQELNPNSTLYKKIASAVNDGKLVPEDVIFSLLSKRLEEGYHRGETGFILHGIPRTTMQAEILDEVAEIDLVLNLKCDEESIATATGFNLSIKLQAAHIQSSNPKMYAIWKEKLRVYAEQRKPLEEYYKKQRKLFNFSVSSGPGDTWQGLLAALHLTNMACGSHSSQKLSLCQPNM